MVLRVAKGDKGWQSLKVLGFKGAKGTKGAKDKKVNSGTGCSQEIISDRA